MVTGWIESPRRLFRKAVPQGRSERRGESYSVPYVEPLSDATTPLAAFFNSLLSERMSPEPKSCLNVDMYSIATRLTVLRIGYDGRE